MAEITEDQAYQLVGKLAVTVPGFNDDSIVAYVENMQRQHFDWHIANIAVRHVIDAWCETHRPPWGVLHSAYNTEVRRRDMERPQKALGYDGADLPTWAEGVEIARRAYEQAYKRPTPPVFANMLASIARMRDAHGIEPSHSGLIDRKQQAADARRDRLVGPR